MARYKVQGPDGQMHVFEGPEGASPDEVIAVAKQQFSQPSQPAQPQQGQGGSMIENIVMGGLRGAKDVIDTGAGWLSSKLGSEEEAARVKAMNEAGTAEFSKEYGGSTAAGVARVGGNIVATLPVGGALGAGARVLGAGAGALGATSVAPKIMTMAEALASSGASAGGATGLAGLGVRAAGGAITGGASAAMIDPETAGTGAALGAAVPVIGRLAGRAGEAVASTVSPFFKAGQERIAGKAIGKFAQNPTAAAFEMKQAGNIVPGSLPTAAEASGDMGLAALQRALQNRGGTFANELAQRQAGNNAARTAFVESVGGTPGQVAAIKAARDAATGPMRDSVLKRAGMVPGANVVMDIDSMLAHPDNAGRIAQHALGAFRAQIAGAMDQSGKIDARALYAIRKDINDVLGGKLSGDAGNLRYAAGQLTRVKAMIDDAIDLSSRRVQQIPARGANPTAPLPTWKDYLGQYASESQKAGRMETVQDVLRRIQNGTVAADGQAMLSGAKLNQILKNESTDLTRKLTPQQVDALRRLAGDMNAGQIVNNAGRAVGSNTTQNLAQKNLLITALGDSVGGSTPIQSTLGAAMRLIYGGANEGIDNVMSKAMLDPQEAARLMELAQSLTAAGRLGQSSLTAVGRALPSLPAANARE